MTPKALEQSAGETTQDAKLTVFCLEDVLKGPLLICNAYCFCVDIYTSHICKIDRQVETQKSKQKAE